MVCILRRAAAGLSMSVGLLIESLYICQLLYNLKTDHSIMIGLNHQGYS
jgi:hypothetical protein